jgi:hypothetical protein
MSVDILTAEIAGCGVMKIPIHSVTSYAFYEECVVFSVWDSCQCAFGGLFLHQ